MGRVLIIFLIWAVWSDTSLGADPVSHYLTMRRALADIESGNNPCARNAHSSASGKYQFVKGWDKFFKAKAGYTWSSVTSRKICRTSSQKQDRLFDVYFNEIVSPWIYNARRRYLAARKLSEAELLALVHRQGTEGGDKYLKSGIDPYSGKYGNLHVSAQLRAMRRQMGFYNYLDSMRG